MPECGYTQFYLNNIRNPEMSTYHKLVEIDLKLGIDYTKHLVVAMKMLGRKMKFDEVLFGGTKNIIYRYFKVHEVHQNYTYGQSRFRLHATG